MLYHLERIGRIAAAWAIAIFFASLSTLLWRTPNILLHVDGTLTRTEATLSKANATLSNLDKGTKAWADAAKEQTADIADTALQARGTLSAAQEALQGVSGVAQHAQGTADAATSLLASAQRTTDALPNTMQNLDSLLGDSRSLLLSGGQDFAKSNADLQSLLESHAIQNTLDNVAGMTDHGNAILGDAQKVADKETADWLKPQPWWKAPLAKGGQLIDIGAAVARHTP